MADQSYEAGYRAGHLQGWLDAMAKMAPDQQQRPRPAPQEVEQPLRVPVLPRPVPPATERSVPSPLPTTPPVPYRGYHPGPSRAPAESPEERKARRERRDRQNINVTLYIASLLLVAAATLFVGTGLPPFLRFAGVCIVAALFYSSGLVLHHKVPRLEPASVAFTGTGLALVPVLGLAMYNFVWHNGPVAWLVTSLIGTAAYVAAALRLESRVLVYLSLTFLVSTAWSGVAVLGAALVWYFMVLIAVAALFTGLSLARPGWLPPLFVRPLAVLHPIVVPAVAAAATFLPLRLSLAEHAVVLGLCGTYFGAMAAVPAARFRLRHFYAARAALTVAAAIAMWDLSGHVRVGLLAAVVLLAAQCTGLALYGHRLDLWFPAKIRDQGVGAASQEGSGRRGSGAVALPVSGRWRTDALLTFAGQSGVTAVFAGAALAWNDAGLGTGGSGPVPLWLPVLILLVTAFVVAARLHGASEFLPFVPLAIGGMFSRLMGEWEFAGMAFLACAVWLVRTHRSAASAGPVSFFNARVAATIGVPALVAAFVNGREQGQFVWLALVAAAGAQQVLSAGLQRRDRTSLMPRTTLFGYAAVGTLGIPVLTSYDYSPDHAFTLGGVLCQLAVAVVTGVLLVPHGAGEKPWRPSIGEVLPVVVAGVMVEFAFRWVSAGAGNSVLAIVAAYFACTAVRLRGLQHRWCYWWLCRIAVTLLAVTLFREVAGTSGVPLVAGEGLVLPTVLATVLAFQIVLVLVAYRLGRAPRGIEADVAAVLVLQLIASGLLWPLAEGSWQHVYIPAVAAACAVLAGFVLRQAGIAAWFAPLAFIVLVSLAGGNLPLIELLLGVFALFAAVMVPAGSHATYRGWYFVSARVLTAALAVVFSYDVSASPAVVSVTFAWVLAAQHAVRWLMRHRLDEVPFQQAAMWITLASQAALPFAYFLQHGQGGHSGDRRVLLLELGLLLGSAVLAHVLFAARGALYFGLYAAVGVILGISPVVSSGPPVLGYTASAVVLLALAVLAGVAGVLLAPRAARLRGAEHWLWLAAALAFAVTAMVLAPRADSWIAGSAVLVLAAVLAAASHVEQLPGLYLPAAAGALAGPCLLADALLENYPEPWGGYLPYLASAVAGTLLFAARLAMAERLRRDTVRRWSLAGAALLGFGAAAVAGFPADSTAWAAAAALACAAAVGVFEAPSRMRRSVAEAGALVVVAVVQRAAIFTFDGTGRFGDRGPVLPDPFWAAQWYVVLAAVLAVLRYSAGQRRAGRVFAVAAAALLSLAGMRTVFGGTGAQQLWLLVLLALLLAAGLLVGDRLLVRWGAAGVAACILWAMRGYTFALLALVAVGLIAFAVWRLNRGPGTESAGEDAPARNVY